MSLHVRLAVHPAVYDLPLLLLKYPRSVCQRNSYRPLQITKSMLDVIVSHHEISESFWDLPSCFYRRSLDVEEVFCIPYTESSSGSVVGRHQI